MKNVAYIPFLLLPALAVGCGGDSKNCTVVDHGDDTATISCPDGTGSTLGTPASSSEACEITEIGDGA